jgi:hypothetical protein
MKLGAGYWLVTLTVIGWYCVFTRAEELKPTITPTESHTGL